MEGKCSVGIHDGTTCSNIKRKKTDTLQLESIHNLNDDISHLFSTINSTLLCCKTVTYTEKWLIMQRIGVAFPKDSTICEAHQKKYNQNYRRIKSSCQYPGHEESKKKLSLSPISLNVAYQAQCLFGSAARKIVVPIGGSWCSNCRIRLHPQNVTSSKELLDKVCQICYQSGCLEDRYAKYASNA